MRKRVSVVILIVALIGLAATAAWKFWPREPEPYNVDTYLARELARLQDTDADDLSDSERRIKESVGAHSDASFLAQALFAELARRCRERYDARGELVPPPIPEPAGNNGWADFAAAGEMAQQIERTYTYLGISNEPTAYAADVASEFLLASEDLPIRIEAALKADHVSMPQDMYDVDRIVLPTALTRVSISRARELLISGDRAKAQGEAVAILQLMSKADLGWGLIHELVRQLTWDLLLVDLLTEQPWSAAELEALLGKTHPPAFEPSAMFATEARYLVADAWSEPPAHEYASFPLDEILQRVGYLPVGSLIEAELEHRDQALASRRVAAAKAASAPFSAPTVSAVIASLEPSEVDFLMNGYISGNARVAQLAVVRLRLAHMRGVRGDELFAIAMEQARKSEFLTATVEDGDIVFDVDPEHPLSEYRNSEPLARFSPVD